MAIRPAHGTIIPITGTISKAVFFSSGFIRQVLVKATSASTTFDVTLKDSNDDVVFIREDETGELNELIELPTYSSNYVLKINNASVDEIFNYSLIIHELIF